MIVECIENRFSNIDRGIYDNIYGFDSKTVLPIEIGQKSMVYGITVINGSFWLLVDVYGLKYPMYYPQQIFKVIDKRISRYWQVNSAYDLYTNNAILKFGFKELVFDEYFYGEMIEDDLNKINVFNSYKELMLKEFS